MHFYVQCLLLTTTLFIRGLQSYHVFFICINTETKKKYILNNHAIIKVKVSLKTKQSTPKTQVRPMSPKEAAGASSSSSSSTQLTSPIAALPPSSPSIGIGAGIPDRTQSLHHTQQQHHGLQQQQLDGLQHQNLFEVQGKSGDDKIDELTQTNINSASNNTINTSHTFLSATSTATTTNPVVDKINQNQIGKVENASKTILVTAAVPTANSFTINNSNKSLTVQNDIDLNEQQKNQKNVNGNTVTSPQSDNKTAISTKVGTSPIVSLASFLTLPNVSATQTVTNLSGATSLNVIVSQPLSHFMKSVTIGAATNKTSIFVPNVITSNPQFPVQHQFGLHHHSNSGGPAPNVTVNPNGNFNTNSNAVLRSGFSHGFRPFNIQQTGVNFNLIGHSKASTINSPILAAQLQTINQIASNQAHQQQLQQQIQQHAQLQSQQPQKQHQQLKHIVHCPIPINQDGASSLNTVSSFQTNSNQNELQLPSPTFIGQQISEATTPNSSRSNTPQLLLNSNNNDQQIRVLTPSEIMRTLPSIPNQDVGCSFNNPGPLINVVNVANPTPNNSSHTTTTSITTINNSFSNNNNQQSKHSASSTTNNLSSLCLPSSPTSATSIQTSVAQQTVRGVKNVKNINYVFTFKSLIFIISLNFSNYIFVDF